MRRLPALRPDQLDAEQAALVEVITGGPRASGPQHFALRDADGALRGPFDAMLRSPALGEALQDLGAAVRYRTGLSARVRELAILVVAAHWDSAFEREAHEAVGRAAGLTEAELAAVRQQRVPDLADDVERVAVEVTGALVVGDVDDALWERAIGTLGERCVYELTVLVGYYATLALQLRVFRVGT